MEKAIEAGLKMLAAELRRFRVVRCRFCRKKKELVVEVERAGAWEELVYDDQGNEVRHVGVLAGVPAQLR